jgi:hypothetical protein
LLALVQDRYAVFVGGITVYFADRSTMQSAGDVVDGFVANRCLSCTPIRSAKDREIVTIDRLIFFNNRYKDHSYNGDKCPMKSFSNMHP